ncbi:hypothetical protein F5B20DRAFT_579420 [Whalleya microplaca]|nr:hypothetical protein F5B20DRAFT_579420 [Whalleya microplaca]
MLESISENEAFLPNEEEVQHLEYQGDPTSRPLLAAVALISTLISIVATVIVLDILLISPSTSNIGPYLLPSSSIPPLGNVVRTFEGQSIYYSQDFNTSREAWMSLFPPGMGYVSMDRIKNVGDIPRLFQDMTTDGSGRFCVAAFHQLHCLFLIYEDFHRAMSGELSHTDTQSLQSSHSLHCFDYLRESLMCTADNNLEPFLPGTKGNGVDGFGSAHQCRDFQELFRWSEKFRYTDGHDAEHFEG